MSQQPSIGRIVHYTFAENEFAPNNSRTVPAIIVSVFPEGRCNLRVFADQETDPRHSTRITANEWRTSVNARENAPEGEEYWDWPPRV